jgi:O-antigen/teichoic acid export membrane protein
MVESRPGAVAEIALPAAAATGGARARSAPRLWAQGGWLLGSSAVQSAVAFLANLVLVREIDPAGFGRYALVLAGSSLILSLGSQRLGTLVIRARGAGGELPAAQRERYANALVQETLCAALLLGGWALWSGITDLGPLLLLGAVLLAHLQTNAKAFRERHLAYRPLALLEAGAHCGAHGLSVVLALAGAGALALSLRELTLALLGLAGLWALRAWPAFRWRWLRPRDWLALHREARDLWLDGALEGGFARTVVLAAGAVGGPVGAGLFFQAQRLAAVPHQLLEPLAGRLALNWFSRAANDGERRRALGRMSLGLALPLLLAAGAAVLAAERFVPWLFGADWSAAAPLLPALVGLVVGQSLFATTKMFLYASHRPRILLGARLAQFAGLGAGLALHWLRPDLGVEAVAIGVSLALVSALVYAWLRLGRARDGE